MVKWSAAALMTLVVGLLLVGPASGDGASERKAEISPEERLELNFQVLSEAYDRFERPTIRQFIRRLGRQPGEQIAPAFAWARTKLQVNSYLDSVLEQGCSECALLISTRGKSPSGRKDSGKVLIRPGAFFAGVSEEGKLFCVGPTEPEAHACRKS